MSAPALIDNEFELTLNNGAETATRGVFVLNLDCAMEDNDTVEFELNVIDGPATIATPRLTLDIAATPPETGAKRLTAGLSSASFSTLSINEGDTTALLRVSRDTTVGEIKIPVEVTDVANLLEPLPATEITIKDGEKFGLLTLTARDDNEVGAESRTVLVTLTPPDVYSLNQTGGKR